MKFLCLPGAYGSAKNFEIQLAPFVKTLTSDGTATFFFSQGSHECTPPSGFEDYFGPSPHYRFFDYDGIEKNDILERVRDFPEGENKEDVLRELLPEGSSQIGRSIQTALSAIYKTMDEHGPFDGICAYSEGTVVAGTLIMDEALRYAKEGRPRQIKRAVFFSGWPPLTPDTHNIVLADECEDVIDIPTVHVFGASDPYAVGALALFDVCVQDSATLFDHGNGHIIPRDGRTLKELGGAVRSMGKACF